MDRPSGSTGARGSSEPASVSLWVHKAGRSLRWNAGSASEARWNFRAGLAFYEQCSSGSCFRLSSQPCSPPCAGAPAQSPVVNSQPNAAFLGPWVTFPVQASPRPIVLIDGPVVMSAGFRFPDGPSKVAFQNGAVDPPAQLPTGPAASQSYPLITAASAVALLQSASTGKAPTTAPSAGGRLRIASARLGEATFLTDRGLKSLPAWVFSLAGIDGAFSVLAVAPSAQWAPPGSAPMSPPGRPDIGAIIAADHRTLTLRFTGSPSVLRACGV